MPGRIQVKKDFEIKADNDEDGDCWIMTKLTRILLVYSSSCFYYKLQLINLLKVNGRTIFLF